MNFYNDIDEKACAWTRELITAGEIPPGNVDCCSITDIKHDLSQFNHVHLFNGISGWARALDLARWSRKRPVWCASLPCQSFSAAGRQKGFDDERGQLWFPFLALVRKYCPDTIFGEQVKAAIGFGWVDRIRTDLEAEGYTFGFAVLGAHSIGAPHIRQRIFWVADAGCERDERRGRVGDISGEASGAEGQAREWERRGDATANSSADGRLAEPNHPKRGSDMAGGDIGHRHPTGRLEGDGESGERSEAGRLVLPHRAGSQPGRASAAPAGHGGTAESASGDGGVDNSERTERRQNGKWEPISSRWEQATDFQRGASPWSNFDLIPCLDGKARRIESGAFPLVARLPGGVVRGSDTGPPGNADAPSVAEAQATAEGRVMRLRGYGNSIVPPLAAEFINAFMDARSDISMSDPIFQ